MIQAALDDSGKGQPPVFVIGGYITYVEEWATFADAWQKALDRDPRLEYVKAYEAFGLRGQFRGWSAPARDARLMDFPDAISCCRLAIAFTVEHKNFEDKGDPVWGFKNAYMFTYISVLTCLLKFLETRLPDETIDIVFDRDIVRRRQAGNAYKELFKRLPKEATDRLVRKDPHFEDDKHFTGLQAADLLAHCVRAKYDLTSLYERVRRSPIYEPLMKRAIIMPIDDQVAGYKARVKEVRGRS